MAIARRANLLNSKTACLILMAIWTYAFWPTIRSSCSSYIHSGYDYQGLLILPIVALLLIHNSSSIKRATLYYTPFGLLLLLLCSTVWLFATIVELELLRQVAIISMLIAIVLTTCGKKITSILSLPISCLFLLLPIGQHLTELIQQAFAWTLVQALMLTKQAVYWETNTIFVNNHTYDIHAYLSSMKYMLLFVTLGACYAMFRTKTITSFIAITASFIIMPICILWLSLYSYILLNLWETSIQIIANNLVFIGWSLTIVGLFHAMLLGIFIGDRRNVLYSTDDIDWHNNYFSGGQKKFIPLILASSILLLMPLSGQVVQNQTQRNIKTLPNLDKDMQHWKGSALDLKNNAIQASFNKDQQIVNLSISQHEQRLDSSWKKVKDKNKTIKFEQHKLPIHETVLHNDKNKYKIFWQVNYINGHYTTNPLLAKALTNLYTLTPNGAKTGVISISTDTTKELSTARDRLKNFMQDFTENSSIKAHG